MNFTKTLRFFSPSGGKLKRGFNEERVNIHPAAPSAAPM
jgi:hypothetical protein